MSANAFFKGRITPTHPLLEHRPSDTRRVRWCRVGTSLFVLLQPSSRLPQLCRANLPKIDRLWSRLATHLLSDLIPRIFPLVVYRS